MARGAPKNPPPTRRSAAWSTILALALFTATSFAPALVPAVGAASNAIVAENQWAGSTGWKIPYSGYKLSADYPYRGQIKGYASATSVNKGNSIAFKISVYPAQNYTIKVFRLGYYGGAGGRLMLSVGSRAGTTQATCPTDSNGKIECSWSTSYTLSVPTSWTSGVYAGVLTNSNLYQSYIIFVVRDDARVAPYLYVQPVTTYEAYNNYPDDGKTGKSLYSYSSYGSVTTSGTTAASKVSLDRPYTYDGAGDGNLWKWEYDMIRWLERSGYDITYSTDVDTHETGSTRLPNFRGVLSVGHSEYWSKQMYDAYENARDKGVGLGFFGANDVYWQIRFESSNSGVKDRVIVCYKSATKDPITTASLKTTNWRLLGRPEQTLIGIQYTHDISGSSSYVVTNASNWVFRNTGFKNGDAVAGIVGGEGDRYMSEYPLPTYRYYDLVSKSTYNTRSDPAEPTDYANTSIYQAPSRAWVFAVGSFQWVWALDRAGYADSRIQKTAANVLAAMTDKTAPTVTGPTAAITPYYSVEPSTIRMTVSWGGSDAATFVEAYQLQQSTDGGTFATVSLPTPGATTVDLYLADGHTYQFRVSGSDASGNSSSIVSGPVYTLTTYQETSSSVTYAGEWTAVQDAIAFGGGYQSTTAKNASASLTFTGRAVAWIAPLSPNGGQVSVYVDGTLAKKVSLYLSNETWPRQQVALFTWSSVGTHTIRITNTATSGHPEADLDAFVVLR